LIFYCHDKFEANGNYEALQLNYLSLSYLVILHQNHLNGMAKTPNTPTWCKDKRREVMQNLENFVDNYMVGFQKTPEHNWQPTDFLPDSSNFELFVGIAARSNGYFGGRCRYGRSIANV
jgi:hypothetical protein